MSSNHRRLPLLFVVALVATVAALPVKVQPPTTTSTTSTETPPPPPANNPGQHAEPRPEDQLSYNRYLQEIVQALETDEKFKEKLTKAEQVDIRSGQIAYELENVHHHVRNQLDEIKRREVMRLRDLATRQYHLTNDIDTEHGRVPEHLDHENPHTFEIDDLRKLILQATTDLDAIDKQRRQEFKDYELQKEYEKTQKLSHLPEADRQQYQHDLDAAQAEHQKHEKVHYPGNRAQLEEVWEKQDHMEPEDFDPKNFFRLHDIDSNGFLDEYEVSALFQKELDKQYDPNNPNDDMREREEEMERMREEVFRKADTNHDDLISFDEFLAETERAEFKEDPNWEGVDDKKQFTHDEYLAYERQQQEYVQQLIAAGKLPANANMPHATYQGGNEIGHGPEAGQAYHEQQPPMHYQQQQQQQQQPQVQQQQQYQQAPVQQQQQQYQQPQVQQQPQQQYQQPPPVQQQQQQPPVQQQHQQPQQQYQQPPPVQQQQQQPPPVQQQQQQQNQQPQVQQQQQQQPPQAAAPQKINAPPPAVVQH